MFFQNRYYVSLYKEKDMQISKTEKWQFKLDKAQSQYQFQTSASSEVVAIERCELILPGNYQIKGDGEQQHEENTADDKKEHENIQRENHNSQHRQSEMIAKGISLTRSTINDIYDEENIQKDQKNQNNQNTNSKEESIQEAMAISCENEKIVSQKMIS